MRVLLVLLFVVGVGLLFFVAYGVGVRAAATSEVRKALRPLRLTKQDAVLYRQAARILNRLINVTELSGDLAADLLSSKSRQQIEEWLVDYQKEIDKV